MKRYIRLVCLILLVGFVLSACGSGSQLERTSPSTLTITPTVMPSHMLKLNCKGKGEPAVIVDTNINKDPVESQTWEVIGSKIAEITRFCVYDHAGIVLRDSHPGSPPTSQDIVDDLHKLLGILNIPQHYILVGHSLDGINVRQYAGQYPDEIDGLVLIDSVHPDQEQAVRSLGDMPLLVLRRIPDDPNLVVDSMLEFIDDIRKQTY